MSKIKQLAISKGITLIEMAHKSELSTRQINRYIRGRYDKKLINAKKIADALGIKVDDLV